MQKLGTERWGKITFKTSVEIFDDNPKYLHTVVKRLFRLAWFSHNPLIVLVNDLSNAPLFDASDQEQQGLLSQVIDEQAQQSIEFLPEVYVQDKNGVRELLSGTKVADHE